MKILILDENYPHLNNLMGDVFVHVRAKEYAKQHQVVAVSFFQDDNVIEYEGITLYQRSSIEGVNAIINDFKPDRLVIHFYQSWMLEEILKKIDVPVFIWVHGYEALGWYRRLFNYAWYSPVLLNYIRSNTKQQLEVRKLIKYANSGSKIHFVFVSNWMRRVTEADTLSKISRYSIIPNPIDTDLFAYHEKSNDDRTRILILRSFSTNKYANDLSAKAILGVSKKSFFKELNFTIIGKGGLFRRITDPLVPYSNISITEGAVRQVQIPDLHTGFGVFLCPTRQDAQGVSMCEAMSSGLVPITSNNTAIPEFVENDKTGIVTNSVSEIERAFERLYSDPIYFKELSRNAAKSIRSKCSIQKIVKQELTLIQ
ncbi:MAG: glycosyltransferase family 4 protein [Chitinophagaceae bacterium]|nr:glycosyltransferase family 4 protein [Chitinophagaceae bacterium]